MPFKGVIALDAGDGREIWRRYSVPEKGSPGELRASTGSGDPLHYDLANEHRIAERFAHTWRFGGGSIWTKPAIDPELDQLCEGTGNPSPQVEDTTRPGDNLHTASLVMLDLETVELLRRAEPLLQQKYLFMPLTADGARIVPGAPWCGLRVAVCGRSDAA